MSDAQKRALETHWPRYGLEPADLADVPRIFGRTAPCTLEIGFGMGDSLLEMALATPETDFIGVEVHRPGIGHLLLGAARAGLTNLRVIDRDVIEVLGALPGGAIERLQIFFPDPWPKKKHHKRRLISNSFLDLALPCLVSGGRLHIATDWVQYAAEIQALVAADDRLVPCEPPWRPETKYERRGVKLGHEVFDIACRTR
jgi:tRNA (guanine-N7-)-methyltransferase